MADEVMASAGCVGGGGGRASYSTCLVHFNKLELSMHAHQYIKLSAPFIYLTQAGRHLSTTRVLSFSNLAVVAVLGNGGSGGVR